MCEFRKKVSCGSSSDSALICWMPFLLLNVGLFLTVKVGGGGRGAKRLFFLSSSIYLQNHFFPTPSPLHFLDKIRFKVLAHGNSISWLTRRRKGGGGEGGGEKVGGEGGGAVS